MSFNPNSLEDILGSAANGGWDWFDSVPEHVRKAVESQRKLSDADARAIDAAWREFYETPGGRKALEALFESTLRRTTFFVNLGLDIQSMAVFGAFREGQNALAHEIARRIARGMGDDLKQRE